MSITDGSNWAKLAGRKTTEGFINGIVSDAKRLFAVDEEGKVAFGGEYVTLGGRSYRSNLFVQIGDNLYKDQVKREFWKRTTEKIREMEKLSEEKPDMKGLYRVTVYDPVSEVVVTPHAKIVTASTKESAKAKVLSRLELIERYDDLDVFVECVGSVREPDEV